ncbi:MAG: DNA polymerase III subunit gamma/tau [Bacteroidales bacterium]|nr:DNA polymerase III subunit gamma/tau [Bacteroidales bacterium]
MAEYIVSARKYRPDSFSELIGQDNIAQTLKNSIQRGKLAHAYLFCGPRGVGKTSTARIFAKTINCTDPGPGLEPCGHCESCVSFQEGRSYCIHELDAASNNGIEDMKALIDQVNIPPQVGKYSVFIIDEVHMLSSQAFNAFLKTLEEPPAHAIFILATTEKHKILPTILSRCQTYDFNRISISDMVANLRSIASKEGVTIDDRSLYVIAGKADGAMRDALTIFDQTVAFCGTDVAYDDVIRNLNVLDYEYSFRLVDCFLTGDFAQPLLIFDEILSKGFNALHFMASLSSHLRDLVVAGSGGLDSLLELPDSLRQRYLEQASRCPLNFLYNALALTTACEAEYKYAVNPRLHIEFTLMKLAWLCRQGEAPAKPVAAAARQQAQPAEKPAPKVEKPAPKVEKAEPKPEQPEVKAEKPEPKAEKPAAPVSSRGSALSLSAMMNRQGKTEAAKPVAPSEDVVPEDDSIREKWNELARKYASRPRLATALSGSKLEIASKDGYKEVTFNVLNVAQEQWLREKMLRSLERDFQTILGTGKVRLEVGITPQEETKDVKYMPSDQAKDLMSKNGEVRNLVRDLDLDV